VGATTDGMGRYLTSPHLTSHYGDLQPHVKASSFGAEDTWVPKTPIFFLFNPHVLSGGDPTCSTEPFPEAVRLMKI